MASNMTPHKAVFLWVSVGYIVLRLFIFTIMLGLNNGELLLFPDSIEYTKLSNLSIFNSLFYLRRPFVFLLILKIVQQNYVVLAVLQWIISVFAWLFLALNIKNRLHHSTLALIATIFVLFFSCNGYITCWDCMILTESLTISLMAILLGLYVRIFDTNHLSNQLLMWLCIVSLLLMLIRDANVIIVFFMGLFVWCASWWRRSIISKKRASVLLGVIILGALLAGWSAHKGERWFIPFANLMATRLIEDTRVIRVFEQANMPASLKTSEPNASFWQKIFRYQDTAADELDWMKMQGKAAYQHYLMTHPKYVLSAYESPLFWTSLFGAFDLPVAYFSISMHDFLQRKSVLYFTYFLVSLSLLTDVSIILMLLVVGVLFYKKRVRHGEGIILSATSVFLISITASALCVWHADGIEFSRHQLMNHLQIMLALLVMGFVMLDTIISAKLNKIM